MCLILTSVQLLQNRRGLKQKLKLPIFGKTDKIARTEKNLNHALSRFYSYYPNIKTREY